MKPTRSFSFDGGFEIANKLNQMDILIRRETTVKALSAGAGVIKRRAVELAPVYTGPTDKSYYKFSKSPRKPGTLKKAIKVRPAGFYGGVPAAPIVVADNLGHLIEFGHKTRAGTKLHRNVFSHFRKARNKPNAKKFVAPQPYMRPALDETQDKVLEAMEKQIMKALKIR